jgi:DNA polymerase (family 10)
MSSGKMPLAEARKIADEIVAAIRPFCDRAEVAGSIRRRKEIVGDVEIVAIPRDFDGLVQTLAQFGQHIKPGVPDVIPWQPKKNAKYIRLRLTQGINLDVFCASRDNWGPLFVMRTGSGVGPDGNPFGGFVPHLFKRWKKVSAGGRMTGCMPTTVDGVQLTCEEEEDFFELLGLEWVDPWDRVSNKSVKVKKESKK